MLSNEFINYVVRSVSLADTITRHTRTRVSQVAGVSFFRATCPFHRDHKESLVIDNLGTVFYCWKCFATGDVLDFVSRASKCNREKAAQNLAEIYKITGIDERIKNG